MYTFFQFFCFHFCTLPAFLPPNFLHFPLFPFFLSYLLSPSVLPSYHNHIYLPPFLLLSSMPPSLSPTHFTSLSLLLFTRYAIYLSVQVHKTGLCRTTHLGVPTHWGDWALASHISFVWQPVPAREKDLQLVSRIQPHLEVSPLCIIDIDVVELRFCWFC